MSRLGLHVLVSFWKHSLLVASTILVTGVGLRFALARPGHRSTVASMWETALTLLPRFPAVVVLFAAVLTIARLRRSGSLVALPVSGRRLGDVGTWLLVGSLPFALFAQLADSFPSWLLQHEAPGAPGWLRSGRLAGGGLYASARPDETGTRRAAALDIEAERLTLGRSAARDAIDPGELRLEVSEEWDLRAGVPVVAAAPRALASFPRVRAPRSLVFGLQAAPLDVVTLGRWLSLEPDRDDLRFARASKLTAGLRVLVLALLGFGLVLRPGTERVIADSARTVLLAAAFFLADLASAVIGVVGSIPPALAALAPSVGFGTLGVCLWAICDHRTLR